MNLISQPIPGVAVFNDLKTKTAITDFDGNVDLDSFSLQDKIHFQHLSYHKISIQKSTIQDTIFISQKQQVLNEIVISASKFEQSKKEVPQNIISITPEDSSIIQSTNECRFIEAIAAVFLCKKVS